MSLCRTSGMTCAMEPTEVSSPAAFQIAKLGQLGLVMMPLYIHHDSSDSEVTN